MNNRINRFHKNIAKCSKGQKLAFGDQLDGVDPEKVITTGQEGKSATVGQSASRMVKFLPSHYQGKSGSSYNNSAQVDPNKINRDLSLTEKAPINEDLQSQVKRYGEDFAKGVNLNDYSVQGDVATHKQDPNKRIHLGRGTGEFQYKGQWYNAATKQEDKPEMPTLNPKGPKGLVEPPQLGVPKIGQPVVPPGDEELNVDVEIPNVQLSGNIPLKGKYKEPKQGKSNTPSNLDGLYFESDSTGGQRNYKVYNQHNRNAVTTGLTREELIKKYGRIAESKKDSKGIRTGGTFIKK
ncbi:MAG: hypothetical protein [Circular genetic element sp.]|nr:MAG: hypothetical protein [Circular genetic element sp.]